MGNPRPASEHGGCAMVPTHNVSTMTAAERVATVLANAARGVWSRGLKRAAEQAAARAEGRVVRRAPGRRVGGGGGDVDGGKVGKGVDGGERRGGWVNGVQAKNTDRFLTWGPRLGCLPTTDVCDRAHGCVDADGQLLNGARIANASPRMYPRSALNGAGVALDTVAERLDERQRRLVREGLEVGGGGNVAEHVHAALGRLESLQGRAGLRRAVAPPDRRERLEVDQ